MLTNSKRSIAFLSTQLPILPKHLSLLQTLAPQPDSLHLWRGFMISIAITTMKSIDVLLSKPPSPPCVSVSFNFNLPNNNSCTISSL